MREVAGSTPGLDFKQATYIDNCNLNPRQPLKWTAIKNLKVRKARHFFSPDKVLEMTKQENKMPCHHVDGVQFVGV
jgi:hypothetical protein